MVSLKIRKMTLQDMPILMKLKNQNNWNQLEIDWKRFMRINPGGCFVALKNNSIIGTVTTIPYQNSIGWIGMLLVDENCRSRGIGSALLQRGIEYLQNSGKTTIKLDATELGKPLYLNRGFKIEACITRYLLEKIAPCDDLAETSKDIILSPTRDDIQAILKVDLDYIGYDRSSFLEEFVKDNLERTFISRSQPGYITGRNGFVNHQIGPFVASGFQVAKDLLLTYILETRIKSAFIDTHSRNDRFNTFLERLGAIPHRELIRMYLGESNITGLHENEYAISGPEKG
ncbi:MAG: GNAT family N-acetyltransferase [Candidatus Hodarchaeota archaeon]